MYQVRGPACWVRHQITGKTRELNREKLTIVDPNIEWDTVRARPIRNPRRTTVPNVNDEPLPMLRNVKRGSQNRQADDRPTSQPVPPIVAQPKTNVPCEPKRRHCERIANQTQSMTHLSSRADEPMETESYDRPDEVEDIEVDRIVLAIRKRHFAKTSSCQVQKRAQCDAIAAVARFYSK